MTANKVTDRKLVYHWASVVDGGPTVHQHWVSVLCLGWDKMDSTSLAMANTYSSSLGQSHANAYRRSLAVWSTIISSICLRGHLGGVSETQNHWMFQIYKNVIKGLSFWTVRCTEFRHIVAAIRELGTQWHRPEILSLSIYLIYHTNGNKQALLSGSCQALLIGRSWDARHSRYLAI